MSSILNVLSQVRMSESNIFPSESEKVRILESSLRTKHRYKSRQSTDLPEIEEAQFDITQPSTDEIIGLKPPVIKKRKKLPRKPPSDIAAEDVESVPSVEIKQSSTDHDHYKKIKKEDKKDKVIQKEELPISNLPPSSRMMKYGRSSKQYTKSRSSYLLPERMQRLRRDGGLGDVSTSSELSFNEWKVKETINQITQDEFFTKDWNDNVIKQKNSIYDYFSTIGSQSLPFINNEQLTVVDELQPKSVKSKRYRSHSKRIGSNIDEHLTELPHENQPLLGFVERTQYDLLMFGRSTYLTNQERIKYESKFLYNPPDTEVSLQLKTGGKLPRYLEDEGYFIGKLPYVAPTNLRRLENRIIKEIQMDVNGLKSLRDLQSADMELFNGTIQQDQELENKKLSRIQSWFREDGLLDLQPNPLRNIPSRPSLWDDQFNPKPEKLQVFYVYPLSHEMTLNYLNSKSRSLQSQSLPTTLSCKQNSWLHNNDNIPECRLQVDIRRITFDFHSLFSLEHVHAQNLRQIIQVYELTLSRDQVNACIQRINALKRALEQLEEKRMNKENILNQNELLDIDRRIEDYYHEINLMRRARNHAEAYEKGLLTSALRAWKRVKEARESSGCINTTIRLKITKQITNVEQDQEDWNKELNEIVDEAKHEFDKQFKEERQRLRESGQTDGDWEDSAELEREDAQILAKKTLNTPPIRPKPFNAQMIKDEIEANLKKTRRLPNEPKITVSLVNDTVLSTNNECSSLLTHNFTLDFHWILPILIRYQPESIVAKLYEKHGWDSYQIAKFHITLPNYTDIQMSTVNQTNLNSELDLQHLRFTPHSFNLQSLIYPTPSYLQSTQLFQSNPLFLNDTNKSEDEQRYTTSVLDPNNTTDAKLLNLIQTATGKHLLPKQLHTASCPEVLYHTRASGVNYFHLNFLIECYNFCTDEDLDKSKRLRLIQLREKGIPEFQNIIIPPLGKHIPEEIFDKSVREIVIEEEIPNILFLLPFFKKLFEPKRPLRPSYQERRRIGPQYVQDSCLSLIVTLHGAYNLPNRCTRRRDQSNRRDKAENRNETLKPFAEIKFQQNKRSTITSEGRNPSWNTEFRFTFFLPPDKPKLECMKDPIIINVYDQISGKINLSIPLILHGYETLNLAKSSIRPMIDVLMTLEPSIFPPEPLIDTFISVESIEIQTSLSKWYQKLSKHKLMTNRLFKPLVMNSDCHEVLMTRFLTSLNPPEEFLPGTESRLTISESMLCVARYVSLIPYESDVASFPGMAQVWCTCDQFLSRTVYVMTEDLMSNKQMTNINNWRLWNPVTGQHYSVHDVNSPLRSVWGLVNSDNITRLNYEFMKDFNKMLENLEKNNGAYYDDLSQLLDRISDKYYVYGFPMNFSYMEPDEIVSRVKSKGIHELIGSEFTAFDVMDRTQLEQHKNSVVRFSKTTLNNTPDTIFSPKQSISSLRMLQSDSSFNVQFALNVYVKAYPGPVLSIWIYMAALWRRVPKELS
ncbi:Coiled-coil and C2 domain-containing protein 2A [Schistosoma japonicum]|nr:Coiled-coil and C2 domain-containing protein 2A [Schistosoma japonicum]